VGCVAGAGDAYCGEPDGEAGGFVSKDEGIRSWTGRFGEGMKDGEYIYRASPSTPGCMGNLTRGPANFFTSRPP
jgi:hypothetical protein